MKVIVTGASKGIGRGIAEFLASDGHPVALMARSASVLQEVRDGIEMQGGSAWPIPCDVRDPEAVADAVQRAVASMDGVDVLVNNAGLVIRKDVFTLTPEEWRIMVDTNISGMFYMTQSVLPYFRRQGVGHIINVSSISGRLPLPGGSAYAATKHAVTGFSQSLFQEVRDYGIRVTTVYPGSIDSASHRHDPREDHSWKVQPAEVGGAIRDLLAMEPGTVISELEIRPLRRPPR